jgi:hypothetical protein
MKTVAYNTVLRRAAELSGRAFQDDTGASLLTQEASAMLRGFIGSMVSSAWTDAPWPETCVSERRRFAPDYVESLLYAAGDVVWDGLNEEYAVALKSTTAAPSTYSGTAVVEATGTWYVLGDSYEAEEWSPTQAYSAGDIVWHSRSDAHYAAHSAVPAGTAPTNAAYWGTVPVLSREILYQADGETVIGDVFGVFAEDPRKDPEADEVDYTQREDGIHVLSQVKEVWVRFWTMPPSFVTAPSTIPHRFADMSAFGAAGLMMRADGKTQAGNELISMSLQLMKDQRERLGNIDTRVRRFRVR